MRTGVYQWDREPTKAYIRRHGAEPPGDGFGQRLREAPAPLRAALNPEGRGRFLEWFRARFAFDGDGSWRLLHFDIDAKDWIVWAAGTWVEDGSSIQLTMRELEMEQTVDPSPLVLEADGDRLLLDRPLAGSLFGLVGFLLVSPLPEPGK